MFFISFEKFSASISSHTSYISLSLFSLEFSYRYVRLFHHVPCISYFLLHLFFLLASTVYFLRVFLYNSIGIYFLSPTVLNLSILISVFCKVPDFYLILKLNSNFLVKIFHLCIYIWNILNIVIFKFTPSNSTIWNFCWSTFAFLPFSFGPVFQ